MPPLTLTQNQNTQDLAILDDRRAEETVVALLPSVDDALIARMGGCVIEVDGLGPLAHQTDQSAPELQAHPPHGILAQTIGRMQDMPVIVEVVQIHRANIGAHRLFDAMHDDGERLLKIRGVVDFLNDPPQGFQHAERWAHALGRLGVGQTGA